MINKIVELTFIIVLGLSYVIVYEVGSARSVNECKLDLELKQIQLDSWVKPKGHKK